ncbi:MAG: hypothetical protein CME40_12920 [Haliea sp.]|nr:hypothetical protein [Haliea sp.]|tara:strand:+ start:86534 stop:88489 length:1956 start_codon:yes stop_codon:yes gene_type:complete
MPEPSPYQNALPAVALTLLIVLVYISGLTGPWLFDDHSNLQRNSHLVFAPVVADEWRTAALSSDSGPLRRPLAMFSFAVNSALGDGLSPLAVKATNLGIHLLAGLLLGGLALAVLRVVTPGAEREERNHWIALLAAALWLLQPLHVSTVLYAVQRMAQLAALFMLAGLWLFVHLRQRWAEQGAGVAEVAAAGLWLGLLTGLAALGKENGLLLPWLLVAVEVSLFRGRWAGRDTPWLARLSWAALLAPILLAGLLLWLYPEFFLRGYGGRDFSLGERLLTQARLLWQYLYWLLVPAVGEMGLHHDDIRLSTGAFTPWTTLPALLGWPLLVAVALWLRGRVPLLLLAVLFYLIGHAMESTLWPLEMVFEHRNYFPSVGWMLLLAWALVAGLGRLGPLPAVAVPLAWCLLLAGFLFIRTSTWSEELRLAQVNMLNHPESVRARHAVANILLERYLNPAEYGLEGEERAAYLVEARRLYAENASRDAHDLGSLVMLYQLDSAYFHAQTEPRQWLEPIRRAIDARPLQVSDHIALRTLMTCLGEARCRADAGAAEELIALLRVSYPGSSRIADLHYRYLRARGVASDQRVSMLEETLVQHPHAIGLRYRRMEEAAEQGDYGSVYEQMRAVLVADDDFRQLSRLRALFAQPGASHEG